MTLHQKIVKPKLGLLELGKQLGNVAEACRIMGYSRDSYYRFLRQYEMNGEEGLKEISKSRPNLKNRVEPEIEEAVLRTTFEYPAYGQVRISNELKKEGLFISPREGCGACGCGTTWRCFRNALKPLKQKPPRKAWYTPKRSSSLLRKSGMMSGITARSRANTPDTWAPRTLSMWAP